MGSVNIRSIAEELIQALERRREEDKYRVEGIIMLHNRINEQMEKAKADEEAAMKEAEVTSKGEDNETDSSEVNTGP